MIKKYYIDLKIKGHTINILDTINSSLAIDIHTLLSKLHELKLLNVDEVKIRS